MPSIRARSRAFLASTTRAAAACRATSASSEALARAAALRATPAAATARSACTLRSAICGAHGDDVELLGPALGAHGGQVAQRAVLQPVDLAQRRDPGGEVVRRLRREGDRQAAHRPDAALLVALAGQVADRVERVLGGLGVDGHHRRRPWPRWPGPRPAGSRPPGCAARRRPVRPARRRGPVARPASGPGCGAARRRRWPGRRRCPPAGPAARRCRGPAWPCPRGGRPS